MHRLVASFCAPLTLVLLGACTHDAPPPATPSPPPPPAAVAGMPGTDHTWTRADFEAALATLSALPAAQLPRGPSASAMFDRLTDPATLAPCADPSVPAALRIRGCGALMTASNRIARLYGAALQTDLSYGPELLRLLGFVLREAAALLVVGEEFVATLDPSDPRYAARMDALAGMRDGALEAVGGALTTLTVDRRVYDDAAAAQFARIVAETYPALTRDAPASDLDHFTLQLTQIANTDPSVDVREALARWGDPH